MRNLLPLVLLALVLGPVVAQDTPVPGIGPFGATVSPDGTEVYVPLFGQYSPTWVEGTTAVVLDAGTGAVVGTIPTGVRPEDVAFTPDGSHALITSSSSSSVTIVDTRTRTVVDTVVLGTPYATFLFGIQIGQIGKGRNAKTVAYVNSTGGNYDGSEENIFVLDADPSSPTFGQVLDTIEMSGGFTRGALAGKTYVTPRGFPNNDFGASPELVVFGTRHNDLEGTTRIVPAPGGVHGIEDVAVDARGKIAYAAAYNWAGGSDEVFVVDLENGEVSDIVRLGTTDVTQHGIGISPDGLLVLVTNFISGTVSWIFTPTHTVIAETPTGAGANEVAFTPDGGTVFVTNQLAGTVSRLEVEAADVLVPRLVEEAIAAGNVTGEAAAELAAAVARVRRAVARGNEQQARAQLAVLVRKIREYASAGLLVIGTRPKDRVPPAATPNEVPTPLDAGGVDTFDPAVANLSK